MKKTILITGSTDGIGKLTALRLAAAGHLVYIHGRNPEKVTAVTKEVQQQANNPALRGFVADFSDLGAVREMSSRVATALPTIDVLINNAGVFNSPEAVNADGLDLRVVVNYLAPVLLTQNLLPQLRASTDPRLINLSSAAQAPISLALLSGKAQTGAQSAYAQSKLALTMWSLAQAQTETDIAVVAVNPGSLLQTKMVAEAFGTFWGPADKGAAILERLAIAEDRKTLDGKYFDNDQGDYGTAHPDAYHPAKIAELRRTTEAVLAQFQEVN
ncbi:MAG: SDR family NAD(P)-dependent oxidoreductase [Bacteroidota bacterium]